MEENEDATPLSDQQQNDDEDQVDDDDDEYFDIQRAHFN
jgi:hypothetical protein